MQYGQQNNANCIEITLEARSAVTNGVQPGKLGKLQFITMPACSSSLTQVSQITGSVDNYSGIYSMNITTGLVCVDEDFIYQNNADYQPASTTTWYVYFDKDNM